MNIDYQLSQKESQDEFKKIIAEMNRRGIVPRIRYELYALYQMKSMKLRHKIRS